MNYIESHKYLMENVDFEKEVIDLGDVEIRNIQFESEAYDLIPGAEEYHCAEHGLDFGKPPRSFVFNTGHEDEIIDIADTLIKENRTFYCPVFLPKTPNPHPPTPNPQPPIPNPQSPTPKD